MARQFARLKGEWFEVAGLRDKDLSLIQGRIESFVLKRQAGHAQSRPWANLKEVTKQWKEESPLFRGRDKGILSGRTGRLLETVKQPKVTGSLYKDGFTVDVDIGRGLKTAEGAHYPAIVQKGWRQTATASQAGWMRRHLKMKVGAGYSFSTPARNLFGFDEKDVSKEIRRSMRLIDVKRFFRKIPLVGRLF